MLFTGSKQDQYKMDTTISNEAYDVVTAATTITTAAAVANIKTEKVLFTENYYEINRSTPEIFLLFNLNNGQTRQGQPWSHFCNDVDTALQHLVVTKWILRGFCVFIIVANLILLSAYYWWPDNNSWLNSTTMSIITLILVSCNVFFTQLNSVLHYKTSSRVHALCAATTTLIKNSCTAINDHDITIVLKGAYDINDSVCKVACRTPCMNRDIIENWYIEVSNEQLRTVV
ncbi:hypothetical protein FRACYDRAFT_270481 [Fragilariopsis cylindrus CCMP1102]|uniref:Uncharacterized protein n=1 Tax=Fragilariopsis cylindrus CCMP1102 TaxID=635003 RepID=A0A1E7F480_9STRA|nr:hypothetical protein FRACYDRAFT_270481 [Fragilariopsis cylindrus CCMP1102]|eukprot:OEU12805.1 hypothetical protein FRACYDRAFT_270481 [Fragilariopsis cylindrus CCMP1102]